MKSFRAAPALLVLLVPVWCFSQDILKTTPRYPRYLRISQERTNAFVSGALNVTWKDGGQAFEYSKGGKRFRYDIRAGKAEEVKPPAEGEKSNSAATGRSRRRGDSGERPARGRQYASATSPDGKLKALYRDQNLWLEDLSTTNSVPVTTEGNPTNRIKLGTATWTYGEELDQVTAMWWSSNSQKIAFYRFDESSVPDYHLALNQAGIQTRLDVEPYPKAGGTNPVVDLFVYDVNSRSTVRVDVRDGQAFTNSVPGYYVYGVSWRNSKELLFHRTNRRQNVMELCAADPETGLCRVIVREEWLPSWTENSPALHFLKDHFRFIWASERSGWKNFYLYDLEGRCLATLTDHCFDVAEVVDVDEEAGLVFYTARSGDNPLKIQLHSVRLDGTGDRRLTNPAYHHRVSLAPDFKHLVDIAQTHDEPPVTRLLDSSGNELTTLATSDLTKFHALGLRPVELLRFRAADGQTPLFGMLHFPSDFDPKKKYPLLVDVYAGPGSNGAREEFALPNILTELGFLFATLDSRSASGRGKRALDSIYRQFGRVEIDDQAAGVKSLWSRRYLDRERVGIYGTSYGGTASGLCLMRYPEVFHAACASSAVTDFRNYDTVYTERYLRLPQDDPKVYDAVRLMSHVGNLRGHLMLFYGTADDNVHPSNTLQLVKALQEAGKSFELQVGPDQGHAGLNRDRMMEFFINHLCR